MSEATQTQKRPLPLNLLITVFIVFWVVLAAFPFVWTVWGSFKVEPDFFSRESWWNAIFGTYTKAQTGSAFTGDGCSRFQAFRRVIIPVMWPGVVTTGLFSFLLAYNDFATTSMLLSADNQTMVPKISSFLGSVQEAGNVMYAVAAVVSATVPLFILVLFFQRQIVSGLTAGAVKG
jgi:ABC-type glycerol-3-phosphate transport system permease component